MSSGNCLFCKIIAGDIPAKLVYEDEKVLAFDDINPEAPVHILIVPKTHISGVDNVTALESELMGHLIYVASVIARKLNVAEGAYRLVFNNGDLAGQTVFHIHLHFMAGRRFNWPPG